MAEDWASDVRKYASDADDAVIAGIVRHCGVALRSRDASLVSFVDAAETAVVRDNFCRKKLGLDQSDAELDAAIAAVGERMQADRTKNRVTVYYLLAEGFGKLGLFVAPSGKDAAAAPVAPVQQPAAALIEPAAQPAAALIEPAAQPAASSVEPVQQPEAALVNPVPAAVAAAPIAAAAVAAPTAAPARAAAHDDRHGRDVGTSWGTVLLTLGVLGAGIFAAAGLGGYMGRLPEGAPLPPPAAATAVAVAPAPPPAAAPVIPAGSGVVAQNVAGTPQLSIYFDTASADVSADFAAAAAPIKAYVDANPGTTLVVSGYNDPRGDAAMNAELSKSRAQGVQSALVALGVPAAAIALEKPPETTAADVPLETARRVDVVVRGGG